MRDARGRRSHGTAVKVVVTGPFAAGKTTLIQTISEITVLSTETEVTDETRSRKTGTTVAMDFGRITVDRDLVLYLFGTPGQERFDFMREVLGEGMLGYVCLLDGTQDDPAAGGREILDAFRAMADVPFVVAVNHRDALSDDDVAAVRAGLEVAETVPVLAVDARDKASAKAVLLALLHAVLAEVQGAPAAVGA